MGFVAQDGKALFGMSAAEVRELFDELGERPFRATQLIQALYRQRVSSLGEITTLSLAVREHLSAAGYVVGLPELAQTAKSVDGTERYLVRLADGETVETVWMPDGDGAEPGDEVESQVSDSRPGAPSSGYKRATICVSSQVGWAGKSGSHQPGVYGDG